MDKATLPAVGKSIGKVIEELGGRFFPAAIKDYPPLETEVIDYDQQLDEAFFDKRKGEDKCHSFEKREIEIENAADVIIDIPDIGTASSSLELKYFLDGTFRTYYWGDVEIGNLSFPVVVGETVVSIVTRENKNFKKVAANRRLNFILPPEEYEEVKEFQTKVNALNQNYEGVNVTSLMKDQDDIEDLKTAMLGKVRAILHEEERKEAEKLQKKSGEVLVIDGDLRKEIFAGLHETIGVAKTFSLRPSIIGRLSDIPITKVLRSLKKGQRTCVFIKTNAPQYKFWYIRLVDTDKCENYWQGIIKVEVNMAKLKQATPEFINYVNQISYLLYKERMPSSYPQKRWASHIYPVYVAEYLAKTSLTSPQVFRQLLKIV